MGGLGDVLTHITNIYLILFSFYLRCRWVGIKLELRRLPRSIEASPASGCSTRRGRAENLSAGRGLGQQGTIQGSAVRESVADHSRYPGACRTLERFVGDVAAEEIFCLVESVSDAHDVAALRFLPRPKQTSRRLTMSLLGQKRTCTFQL